MFRGNIEKRQFTDQGGNKFPHVMDVFLSSVWSLDRVMSLCVGVLEAVHGCPKGVLYKSKLGILLYCKSKPVFMLKLHLDYLLSLLKNTHGYIVPLLASCKDDMHKVCDASRLRVRISEQRFAAI